MPSAFDLQFAEAAAPALLAQFGIEVTCTPKGETAFTLTAMVGNESYDEREDPHGRQRRKVLELSVPTMAAAAVGTPTGNYLTDPDHAATYTVDGAVYHFTRVLAAGPLALLEVESRGAVEITRPNYRRR